jgi:hypothetical protein
MQIVPITRQYWDEVVEELVCTDEIVGYKVVSETGALLGAGDSRAEALHAAHESILLAMTEE